MLTDKDINRLIQVFPTKDEVRTIVQGELVEMKETQQRILTALDRLATAIEKLNLEYTGISIQLSRHERWIQQIAKQTKVKLEED